MEKDRDFASPFSVTLVGHASTLHCSAAFASNWNPWAAHWALDEPAQCEDEWIRPAATRAYHLVLMAFGAYLASRFQGQRSPVAALVQPSELADLLTHIEQSVEAVAIEVERVGEGQRFTTYMLEQRERSRELPR